MKNRFLIATFVGTFLLMTSNAKAVNFTDNQTVDCNKNWIIKFTQDIQLDTTSRQGITVKDSEGNNANIDISLDKDGKSVIVTAPTGGYEKGENYILNIGTKVHSNNGKALNKEYKLQFNIKDDNSIVKFKDRNLEQAVRYLLMKPEGKIYKDDVKKITYLDLKTGGIESLDGIENLVNLEEIDLSFNWIKDVTPLKGLTKLKKLNLMYNWLNDADDLEPLKGLVNLEYLDVGINYVKDLSPLKNLTKLKYLNLEQNSFINDVSALEGLKNLQILNLSSNQIKDISALKGLKNLEILNLSSNEIEDISALKGLINLKILNFNYNKVSNASVLEKSLPKCNIILN